MKNVIKAVGVSLVLLAGGASAGYEQPYAVDVDLTNLTAAGDQWSGRTDANDDVHIGCGVRYAGAGFGGPYHYGFCQAEDADGESIICTTFDSDMVEIMEGAADFSFLIFAWTENDEGDATCSYVGHSTQSFYLPEFKVK